MFSFLQPILGTALVPSISMLMYAAPVIPLSKTLCLCSFLKVLTLSFRFCFSVLSFSLSLSFPLHPSYPCPISLSLSLPLALSFSLSQGLLAIDPIIEHFLKCLLKYRVTNFVQNRPERPAGGRGGEPELEQH